MNKYKWSSWEDEVLCRYYGKWPAKKLAEVLERSQKSVWNRANYLGLSSSLKAMAEERRKKETREEISNLARHYDPFCRPLAIFCIKKITVHEALYE